MLNPFDENFWCVINRTTMEEEYLIKFNFGTRVIDVKKDTKITLNFVHGGFEKVFRRKGYDLIIGDDWFHAHIQRLGVGFGKETWCITPNDDSTYTVEINKYSWLGSSTGYSHEPSSTVTVQMTQAELEDFQAQNNVTVHNGFNTLYTTWAVVPPFTPHYHMHDCGDYDMANGKLILKNYFKYGENNIFVGDELLKDIIMDCGDIYFIDKSDSNRHENIKDTFLSEYIYGGTNSDTISSLAGNDVIKAGKGNDTITLGKGNKTLVITQGDGKDTIKNAHKATSVKLEFENAEQVAFSKSGNNLVASRSYEDGSTENTVLKDYFKHLNKNKIIISNGNDIITENLTQDLLSGSQLINLKTDSTTVKGTNLSDEAFSSSKNETFILGKGNDIIRFRNNDFYTWSPYEFGNDTVKLNKDSHVKLDFEHVGANRFSYERNGNDAVITARHHIDLCGRDNGKEEWVVTKSNGNYTITKTGYYFTGYDYQPNGIVTEEVWSRREYMDFIRETGIFLETGKNTLYTSWAVVANPVKHYSLTDSAPYDAILGTVTLKDYFKYSTDSVYIGDTSLQEIFKSMADEVVIDKSGSKKGVKISDTFFDETITGTAKADKITSNGGNDTITAGKGNDTITLGEGNKIININKGDGKDTIIISAQNTSTEIVFDQMDTLFFNKSGNDLIINRDYENKTEKTIIKNYYKNNLNNNIAISSPDFYQTLTENITGMVWETICKYPPCDDATPVDWNAISQDVSSWQSTDDAIIDLVTSDTYDINSQIQLVNS